MYNVHAMYIPYYFFWIEVLHAKINLSLHVERNSQFLKHTEEVVNAAISPTNEMQPRTPQRASHNKGYSDTFQQLMCNVYIYSIIYWSRKDCRETFSTLWTMSADKWKRRKGKKGELSADIYSIKRTKCVIYRTICLTRIWKRARERSISRSYLVRYQQLDSLVILWQSACKKNGQIA